VPDLEEVETSRKSIQDEIRAADEELNESKKSAAAEQQRMKPIEEKLAAKTQELDDLGGDSEQMAESARQTMAKLNEVEAKLSHAKGVINVAKGHLEKAELERTAAIQNCNETKEKASRYCDEVEVTRSCAALDKEIQGLSKRITQEQKG
jgi:chromosome segregation ATPase